MLIGFSGVHGSGKTTLLKEMIGWPELAGHSFVSGLTRQQKELNKIEINEGGNFKTQQCLVKAMAWHVKRLPNMVVDRTFLDIFAYSTHHYRHGSLDAVQLNYVRQYAERYQPRFRCVFYLEPEFGVEEDGVRSTDQQFASEMTDIFQGLTLLGKESSTKHLVKLTGSVDQRLDRIKETLKNCR